jgi:hypothetical protein
LFGHGDIRKRGHLMVTRRKTKAELAAGPAPVELVNEAVYLQRVLACAPGQAPSDVGRKQYARHCRIMRKAYQGFRKTFIDKARPFLARVVPADAPTDVVYPFGGGDLLVPPVTFPSARVVTTISLESAGDPRRLRRLSKGARHKKLRAYERVIGTLLRVGQNRDRALRTFELGAIPGQLAFSLAAATIHGYTPVSLRYFRIRHDGSLYYLTENDIRATARSRGSRLQRRWVNTDFSTAFRNMEIRYRRPGGQDLIHRHIAANLHNDHFTNSALRKHIRRKGSISALVKGSSYLMWRPGFSAIRDTLLATMKVMISDASSILPRHARAAGFEQTTYGTFATPYMRHRGGKNGAAMRALFKSQPLRPMPFRFGYSDARGRPHLIVTRKRVRRSRARATP